MFLYILLLLSLCSYILSICAVFQKQLPKSAYVHIPFCRRRCFYCDFPIKVMGDNIKVVQKASTEYTDILLKEIGLVCGALNDGVEPLETLYFGGGTPSLMPSHDLKRIIGEFQKLVGIKEGCETTMEMDPATFDLAKLLSFMEAGVNRVSMGIQSFDDALLKTCGRFHSSEEALRAIEMVASAGISDLSIDLISSLPGMTVQTWESTLLIAAGLPSVGHISVYDLQVEEGTAFGRWYSPGVFPLPSESDSAEMYRMAHQILTSHGFVHYEVSNYARPGSQSRHNQKYWACEPVLGFGMGAASYVGGRRFTRPKQTQEYSEFVDSIQSVGLSKSYELYSDDNGAVAITEENGKGGTVPDMLEFVMLALRTKKGLSCQLAKDYFGERMLKNLFEALQPYIDRHLVTVSTLVKEDSKQLGSLKMTSTSESAEKRFIALKAPEGFLLSNDIISTVFAAIDSGTSD